MLIASLVLHQVKEVGAVTQKEIKSECRTLNICKFSFDNIRTSYGCNFALQKIITMQRTHIFKCSENYGFYFRCTKLYTYKIIQNCR